MDEDLEVIVTEGILRTAETFKLEYLYVVSGTTVCSIDSVKLNIN
jgi:2-isopropylmalate synthase